MGIKNIAIIGLGEMGTAIATLLLKAGYNVNGFDIVEKRKFRLVPLGLNPGRSIDESVKGMDLIVLSLMSWDIILEVVHGKEGILKGAQKGQIIIDTSTVPPWETKAMAAKLVKRGIEWMDIPISGSAAQARASNMVFMAGGKKSVFKKVKPVLDKIGKKVVYVGKNGDGAMLKIVVNTILYLNQAAASEGFVLGLKAGLKPDIMFEVVSAGAASSDLIKSRGWDMLMGNFEPKGQLSTKSFDLALESARRLGVMLPMAALSNQFRLQAFYNGWNEYDGTVMMKVYEQLAGIRRRLKKIEG